MAGFWKCCPIASAYWPMPPSAARKSTWRPARRELEEASRKVEETKNDGGGEASDPAVALAEMMRAQAKIEAAEKKH